MKYHFYKFCVEKKYLYRILNCSQGMNFRNIVEHQDGVSLEVEVGSVFRFQEILKQEEIPIIRREESGIRTKLKLPLLKTVSIAMLTVLVGLGINSEYIWKISVDGNYSYTEEQIKGYIYKKQYQEGMKKTAVNCNEIENLLRNKFSDISWVSCEIKGTNLLIHLKENYISEICSKETKPYHLIANHSGVITSIITRSGQAVVKKGDRIKKGDLLISGSVEVRNESDEVVSTYDCFADGDIKAKVKHRYKDSIDKKQFNLNPDSKRQYSFPFPSSYFLKISGEEKRYVEQSSRPVSLFENFYLPVRIYTYSVYEDDPVTVELTETDAERILYHKMLYYFAQLEQKGYKILEKDVKMESLKNKYCLQGSFLCIEPVGKVEYINIENEERESTTNERN